MPVALLKMRVHHVRHRAHDGHIKTIYDDDDDDEQIIRHNMICLKNSNSAETMSITFDLLAILAQANHS